MTIFCLMLIRFKNPYAQGLFKSWLKNWVCQCLLLCYIKHTMDMVKNTFTLHLFFQWVRCELPDLLKPRFTMCVWMKEVDNFTHQNGQLVRLKGIPIRKWRAPFRRGFANFWDNIFKFGTKVNFFIIINSLLCRD